MKYAFESMDVIPQFNNVKTNFGKLDATLCSPRKRRDSTFERLRSNKSLLVTCYLLTWYSFSTASTFTNKVLLKSHHISAEMLTLAHLSVSVICDLIVLTFPTGAPGNSWRLQIICLRQFLLILPLSLLSVLSKVLTYWSYHAVPIAIAHTCKASQPLFNVMLAYFLYRSTFPMAMYLTLVPIVLGVVLASVSEMGMNDLAVGGVVFAVISALLGVCQSMYAKFLLRSRTLKDSANMHFYSSCLSFAINAPLVIFKSYSVNNDSVDKIPQSFPYMLVLCCSLMHFINSFCASLVLSEVSELTFSIMGTMKRVVIILSAVLYFGNPVTTQSVTGMFLAVAGVGAYQLVKVKTKLTESSGLPQTIKDISKDHHR